MDLDKVIMETRDCVWQLKKLDVEGKFEPYSMDRLLAEISTETKRMKDDHVVKVEEVRVESVSVIPYEENMSQNKFLRKVDKKLSSGRIYRWAREKAKKVYRFFVPYLTVDGNELLKKEGELFARVAYKSILLREIDREALENATNNLETGKITKISFLNALCKSEEAQKNGITVKGLRWKLFKQNLKNGIKRIPVLGYAMRWVKCIILLPRMFSNAQNSISDLVLYDKKKTGILAEQQAKLDVLRQEMAFDVADLQGKAECLRRDLEFAVYDQVEKKNESENSIYARIAGVEAELKKCQKEQIEKAAGVEETVEFVRKECNKKIVSLLEKLAENELEIKEIFTVQSKLEEWFQQSYMSQRENAQEIRDVKNSVELWQKNHNEKMMQLLETVASQELELREAVAVQNKISEQFAENAVVQRENTQELLNVKNILDSISRKHEEKLASLVDASLCNEMDIRKVSMWQEEQVQKERIKAGNMLETKNLLDRFYVEYNDKLMCDSREEVAERQEHYLPFIEQHMGDKKQELVMLDLGCGEGEFVELLNKNDYPAYGVDNNPMVIQKVKTINPAIRIVESGAIEYLRGLSSGTVDFISCFHMVEHLEMVELLELLKEMYRVLKVGGSLILETPNPLNILISTYYFYLDPTHKKQIPSELLKLMVSNSGFKVEECRMLRPLNFVPYTYDNPEDKISDIVFRFNMEQAYSIMAVKE